MKFKEKYNYTPIILLLRTIKFLITGRVHFPKNCLGDIIKGDEDFVIFRKVVLDPTKEQPIKPGATFKVCFHFGKFSIEMNKKLSAFPILFIIGQPGFRSKTWMIGKKTGLFQGYYEWDSVRHAESYWNSFIMKMMKNRTAPNTLSYEIKEIPCKN